MQKNTLRIKFDSMMKTQRNIVIQFKKERITNEDYQKFMRNYSYKNDEDVPQKFHHMIEDLKSVINLFSTQTQKKNENAN